MAQLDPGQIFLGGLLNAPGFVDDMIATTNPNIAQRDPLDDIKNNVDPDYLRKLEITSPGAFKDGKEEKPVDISDWVIPDRAQGQYGPNVAMNFTGAKDFVKGFGQRVGDFLQFVPGSEEDPRTLDGAPMPGGMDPNYEALPPGAKERFNNMLEGKESPIKVGW